MIYSSFPNTRSIDFPDANRWMDILIGVFLGWAPIVWTKRYVISRIFSIIGRMSLKATMKIISGLSFFVIIFAFMFTRRAIELAIDPSKRQGIRMKKSLIEYTEPNEMIGFGQIYLST